MKIPNKAVPSGVQLCDFCKDSPEIARYDGKTKFGPWACMCEDHFNKYGVGLGLGRGQKLLYKGSED